MKQLRPLLLMLLACACGGLHVACGSNSDARTQRTNSTAAANATPSPIAVNVIEARAVAVAGDLLVPAPLSIENTAVVLAQRMSRPRPACQRSDAFASGKVNKCRQVERHVSSYVDCSDVLA